MSPKSEPSAAAARLQAVTRSLSSASPTSAADAQHAARPLLGHLTLDKLHLPVYETEDKARLPREDLLLDSHDPVVVAELAWLMKKWDLRQDVFLLTSPGPYTRRLALTFLHLLNTPYELVSLHRDTSEGELKQSREIRAGGRLEYVDSGAVRAAKEGKVLVLDGIERVERGVLPLLNNLLEYREMNLEDGTHIVSAKRYDLMVSNGEDTTNFLPAHPDFRIIALGVPVPPYPGLPIDPPFRSRFQARYVDPVAAAKVMARQALGELRAERGEEAWKGVEGVVSKMAEVMSSLQIAKEMRAKMASGITADSKLEVPLFPQTTLVKLVRFLAVFPLPANDALVRPADLFSLLLIAHPALAYSGPPARRALEEALIAAGFGAWAENISEVQLSGQDDGGIFGWRMERIERHSEQQALVTFSRAGCADVSVHVAAGPLPLAAFPPAPSNDLHITPRFTHMLTSLFQLHALSTFDISFIPSAPTVQSSSASTSHVLSTFASLLGYELESQHLYKELGGRELWMRRVVGGVGGETSWDESPLVRGAKAGRLVWFDGIDTLGPTFNSLARLIADREGELWEGKRLTTKRLNSEQDTMLDLVHPSFRLITTATKATAPTEWLTEEVAANLVALSSIAMPVEEERALLLAAGCPPHLVDHLELFAARYRELTSVAGSKSRRLGTASLVRIARRLARLPDDNLRVLLERALLVDFLPNTEREQIADLMDELGLPVDQTKPLGPLEVTPTSLVFSADGDGAKYEVARFDLAKQDPTGASHVPRGEGYHYNAQQTRYIRDIAIDLELGQHVLLLGNQGTGKNRLTDQLLELLDRPREYTQLHRDSTTQALMFTTHIEKGQIRHVDSPLLRAVKLGRVMLVDEVDKAPPPVVAVFASLASRGEMTLADGRKIRPSVQPGASPDDIVVHPSFRLVLLGNRPGFPFLGNPFLNHLGDAFSTFPIANPDSESELRVLQQLAPELDEQLLKSLVLAFRDLRKEFEAGTLSYPFSLREMLALVRHLRRFPSDPLEQSLRNIIDFDVSRPETLDALLTVLKRYKLGVDVVGMDAVRGQILPTEELRRAKEIAFDPEKEGRDTSLSEPPKFGKDDGKEHHGGNTFAGGTGGRSTAGLGGRGGYMRLYKGHDIHQIPDGLKAQVPDELKDRARDMARRELAAKLAEIDMSSAQASMYSRYHDNVAAHVHQLATFLENLEAKEEERIWLTRVVEGELDEKRLAEGLTGEATVYKRRGLEKPEMGRPQLKPKRIRFVFDVSASMYRNQADGRMARSLEAAVMILEAFDRLSASGKAKYRLDFVGHSGESAEIPFVGADALPSNPGDRWRIVEKMALISQYCWPGDETINALDKAVDAVAEADADDYIVVAITDANFDRYGITAEDLRRSITRNSKVHVALLAIGEGAETTWLPKVLPGKAYTVRRTGDLASTIRAVLSATLDKGL
ncbi:uncharacterized protein JCM10292_005112 [Rhodotorula paludigena]|uniref:uncharacterized protein n=1 Tax=Rhodotorula paludigena TaxID=86838 RepID=UPI00317F9743